MFIIFVDFNEHLAASHDAIQEVEKIVPKYGDYFGFYYAIEEEW